MLNICPFNDKTSIRLRYTDYTMFCYTVANITRLSVFGGHSMIYFPRGIQSSNAFMKWKIRVES